MTTEYSYITVRYSFCSSEVFKHHPEAFSFRFSIASRYGVIQASHLIDDSSAIQAVESTNLDFVGVVLLPPIEVSQTSFPSKSEIESAFFSKVAVYARTKTESSRSSHVRLDSDLVSECLSQFRNKHDYQHSSGSMFGVCQCIMRSIVTRQSHCPLMN